MRALLYVRLSKEDKAGKAVGIDSTKVQTENGTRAILDMGWTVHSVHVDDDYSGTLRDRPGLDVIRAAARAREIDIVAFRRLDRLSRLEAARTMALLLELHDLGVRGWDYEGRRFMSISGTEGLITYVEAMKAEGEAKAASERITAGLRARALDGRAVRGAPWGYRIERTSTGPRWVIDEEQARAVRHVFETFLACGTINGTAVRLNSEGLVTVRGRPWISSGIRAILSRPIYRGTCEHADLTIPHPELRVLSPDLEERVDRLLESVHRAPWGSTPRHLSTPFLRCALCLGSLVATSSKRSKSASLTCDKSRSRGCEGIGYRTENAR